MSSPSTQGDDGDALRSDPGAGTGFLDAAAGLPMSERTRAGLAAGFDTAWADPSRRYGGARVSRRLLEGARASVAGALGIDARGVCFPTGQERAWESALSGFPGHQLVVNEVEDTAALRTAEVLQARGTSVRIVGVDPDGRIRVADAAAAVAAGPSACVVQDVNIEIGTRQPLTELRAAVGPDVPLIVDARGTLGRDRLSDEWDVLLADPMLWGGPPGCAVLAVREPDRFRPQVADTGGHLGVEPAAAPAPLIGAAALALESAVPDIDRLTTLSTRLRHRVVQMIPHSLVVGSAGSAWITMFTFLYVAADEMIDALARRGWSCSSGASCTSDTRRPHHVLVAVGASTHGSLRVSLPPWAATTQLDRFAEDLADVVAQLRREAGADRL